LYLFLKAHSPGTGLVLVLFFAAGSMRLGSLERWPLQECRSCPGRRPLDCPKGPLNHFGSTTPFAIRRVAASRYPHFWMPGDLSAPSVGVLLERVLRAKAREAWNSSTKYSNAPTAGPILSSQPENNFSSSTNSSRTIRNAVSNARPNALPAQAPPVRKRALSARSAERKPPSPSSPPRGVQFSAAVVSSRSGPP
jgi:hypothetical protein